jgi:hypothetical protein
MQQKNMNANDAIQKLFEGVIPERLEEIMSLVNQYSTQFRLVGDREGFNIDGGAFGTVQYTYRSMQQLWLFGYAGLLSLHCYGTFIALIQSSVLPLDMEKLKQIPDQAFSDEKFTNLLNKIKELNNAGGEGDFTWPEEIPKPEHGKPADEERAVVFDLSCMAAAYIFLHEFRHVQFAADRNAPKSPIEEELACDDFAKEMMTSKIKQYSEQSGYQEDKVTMKRAISIAIASSFLLFATAKDKINGSKTHPPVYDRWLNTVRDLELPENDYFWLYFSSLALAMLQYFKINVPTKKVVSFKTLCLDLIADLENGI